MFTITPIKTTTIYLLRNAEAAGYGLDDGLTNAGTAQAQAMVETLKPLQIDGVFTSPAVRAKETAAPTAKAFGLASTVLPDLREHRMSLSGYDPDDPMLELRFSNRTKARPGGETFNAAASRLRQAIKTMSRRPLLAPLLVTHGGLIASVLSQLNRGYGFAEFREMPQLALFKLTHSNGLPRQIEALD